MCLFLFLLCGLEDDEEVDDDATADATTELRSLVRRRSDVFVGMREGDVGEGGSSEEVE